MQALDSGAMPGLAREVADALAKLGHDSEGARMMAMRAGFPVEHLPDFTTALEFWTRVTADAGRGRIGPRALLAEAAQQFPHNAELRALAERLAGGEAWASSVLPHEPSAAPRPSPATDPVERTRRANALRWAAVAGGVGLTAGTVAWSLSGPPEPTAAPTDAPSSLVEAPPARASAPSASGNPQPAPSPPAFAPQWSDGTILLEPTLTMPMVRLDGGTFTMGSPREEPRRAEGEVQHVATVSAFWIGRGEVTQAQWEAVMGTAPSRCDHGCGDALPVHGVTWEDAVRFTNALSRKLGLEECYVQEGTTWQWTRSCDGIRLPTETEWEYAARAGTTTAYPFGRSRKGLCWFANTYDQSAKSAHPDDPWLPSACDDGHVGLARVETFAANPWGLFDTHGNVEEWVWDRFGKYPLNPLTDNPGPSAGETRITRGGSFRGSLVERGASSSRSAARTERHPTKSEGLDAVGFRCARRVGTKER